MKKMIIFSDNLRFCKEIINDFQDSKNETKYYIFEQYEELLEKIPKGEFSIIIIEKKLKFKELEKVIADILMHVKYYTKIIVFSSIRDCNILKENKNVIFIPRNVEEKQNVISFNKVLKGLFEDCEDKIKSEIKKMGFDMKNKGDYILVKVISYCYRNYDRCSNLEKEIYPKVAKIINVSEKQIKWNINYSINSTYANNTETMKRYLSIKDMQKPTTKFLINNVLNNLQ